MKQMPEDTIILHMCTINDNHMMYGSEIWSMTGRIFCHHMVYCAWDMVHDECNCYFLFWAIFCPNSPKNENFKKTKKKHLEILSFCTSVPKIMIICYTVPEIWRKTVAVVSFPFWTIFLPFYPRNSQKKSKFWNNEKKSGYIIILHKCTKNYDHRVYCSWDTACDKWNCYFSFWAFFTLLGP